MFPTAFYLMKEIGKVAQMSQSPQIGSMFPTARWTEQFKENETRRNPLKSGQCFLLDNWHTHTDNVYDASQSPQIGSMFPTAEIKERISRQTDTYGQALESQSPQIGSMFPTYCGG